MPQSTMTDSYLHTEKIAAYEGGYRISKDGKLALESLAPSAVPLVMLHGWQQSMESLRLLATLLSAGREVYLIDLPGFGQSKAPDGVWSAYDYADCIARYLGEQGIQQADFLGHSFGGKVALCMAIKHPQKLRRLILMSASGLKRSRGLVGRARHLALGLMAKALKWIDRLASTALFKEWFAPKFGSSDYRQAGAMRAILVRSVNEDLSLQVRTIQAKTLLLWGREDDQTPMEIALRFKRLIAHSELVALDHKGHMPFEDVGAHLCAKHILSFLKSYEGSHDE